MEVANAGDQGLRPEDVRPSGERIATLEERSQHASTKAEMHRSLLMLFIALMTTLGGLIIHLHNATQAEISEIRLLLIDILQQLPGG